MIPRIIHYCWFGRGEMPQFAKDCIATWHRHMPDWEYKLWNEDNFDVSQMPYTKEAYNAIDAKKVFSELHESKRVIEEKLGVEVSHLSYPHSMQDEHVQRMVAEAGYTSATLGYGGNVRKGDNMYCLNRKHMIQD